jgi:hypothetical protein
VLHQVRLPLRSSMGSGGSIELHISQKNHFSDAGIIRASIKWERQKFAFPG